MVLRLGAVTGVGHARLIFERFGRFWGAFSVIDLFILNALTIVTEFIGITLALDYLGLPKLWGVAAALLIIAIVGTTVAPWQLFFQQSYVIDKRITPRFIKYERVDLMIGIAIVIAGALAIMASTAQTFAGHPELGNFADAGSIAAGMEKYFGKVPATLFALALLDACIIGASAVCSPLPMPSAMYSRGGIRCTASRPRRWVSTPSIAASSFSRRCSCSPLASSLGC
jgi:Mn2+/Fe2+ NRAMP family transporter